ncbi:Torsin-1A [Bulinus truncatus]|nr:Torsin-1A [Bulinus truncatus]
MPQKNPVYWKHPRDEASATKSASLFDNLGNELNSVLSFSRSPVTQNNMLDPGFNSVCTYDSNCDNDTENSHRLTQSLPVMKGLNQRYGIPDEEDLYSQSVSLDNVAVNNGLRKRTDLINLDRAKTPPLNKKHIKAKLKARSLTATSAENFADKQKSSFLNKLLKIFIFIIGLVVGLWLALNYIQKQRCNLWKMFNKSVLEMDLEASVFGQHIAVDTIPIKVDLYLQKFHHHSDKLMECKPLVLSFHGWTGVGKNYISKIITGTLHDSRVNSFVIPFHFPHEAYQSIYKTEINEWIVKNITDCAINVIVIDEMDKAYPAVVEGIAGAVNTLTKPCHQTVPIVFLLLSNSHAVDINRAFLNFMRASEHNTREQFVLKEVDPFLNSVSWFTYLSHRELIDAFVPFLPLEKKHVIQCIKRDLVSKRLSTDSESINKILKELSFSVFGDLVLSNTGCKRVADKVDLIMLDKNY